MIFPPVMVVPVEGHGTDRVIDPTVVFCCLRTDFDAPKSTYPSPQTRTGTQRQRVLVMNRLSVCATVTVGTRTGRYGHTCEALHSSVVFGAPVQYPGGDGLSWSFPV
ncbi:hypothetical protein [Haloquadratum walsbyi]|uniref:Uncharacterized protein n=1 Tax=Haloquadratum walsbyi J07HQW2 TaxID=1238425 RepID=U1PSL2_9EURY|nr:hypothetical protein [Haloquadratum walsbyi]ERG96792.1 MAG: hypothetical protein J07HQW2_03276 [Haloquadratum walsbyi J07HQW2]